MNNVAISGGNYSQFGRFLHENSRQSHPRHGSQGHRQADNQQHQRVHHNRIADQSLQQWRPGIWFVCLLATRASQGRHGDFGGTSDAIQIEMNE